VKVLLVQDVPEGLTYLLRELGHEVLRVRDLLPPAAADLVVLQSVRERGCLLVTCVAAVLIIPTDCADIS
jgi:Domain of unknown function (DUF5615)